MAVYPSLKNKVVIVTGGTKGIGQAISDALLANDALVVATYVHDEHNAQAFLQARTSQKLLVVQSDVSKSTMRTELFSQIKVHWNQSVDCLVNNAGILQQKPFYDITENDWDETFETNLKGAFFLAQSCLQSTPVSSIVNIASIGGQIGGDKAPHYAASKAAMVSMTRSLSRLGSAQQCRVNAVSPGWIETPIFDAKKLSELQQKAKDEILLGRLGQPEEVAAAVLFLLSDDASFITGQCLNINGGMYFG